MYKCYIKGTQHSLSVNYCVGNTSFYWSAYKRSYNCSRLLVFNNKVILWGHILNVCKTRFLKLIFYLLPSYELSDVLLQELCLHSKYVLNHCI